MRLIPKISCLDFGEYAKEGLCFDTLWIDELFQRHHARGTGGGKNWDEVNEYLRFAISPVRAPSFKFLSVNRLTAPRDRFSVFLRLCKMNGEHVSPRNIVFAVAPSILTSSEID